MSHEWKYKGPIFDAHTHITDIEKISSMIAIEDKYGVSKQIGIVHNEAGYLKARELYPDRFIFAKYLSISDMVKYNVEPVLDQVSKLLDEGYTIAKAWFGPRFRDFIKDVPKDFRINHPKLEAIFQTLEDLNIPLIIHVSDPDTYYATHYSNSEKYGLKNDHLKEIEDVMCLHPNLRVQVPHLGAQPEIKRLPDLSRWLNKFPNLVLDTASSRWMARELCKDTSMAREFMLKYQDKVLFGTDLFSGRGDLNYFSGRYVAQRVLWDTREEGTPLPFTDDDTVDIGGTFINGLDLPLSVLRKLYWENANKLYQ
jgi:predicted TIM-barrel fold metal-dependent hydrolase